MVPAHLLDSILEKARAAWPGLALDARAFGRYLVERLPSEKPAEDALRDCHAADLYLACGCAAGDRTALGLLEGAFFAQVPAFISGMDLAPISVDDVRQALREHLLVAGEARRPAIADYAGRGPLVRWLRVTTQRLALNLRRGQKPVRELDEAGPVAPGNPELDHLRKISQGEFVAALRKALAGLTVRERNLMRLHFVDGLSTTEIAGLLKTHRTTIRRQINQCQVSLVARIRDDLRDRLGLSESVLESLLREGRKSLDVSLSTML